MSRTEIEDKVNSFLVEEIELERKTLKPDASLRKDLGIDSLDFVDIAVMVHDSFGIILKAEEMKKLNSLDDLYVIIDKKVNNA